MRQPCAKAAAMAMLQSPNLLEKGADSAIAVDGGRTPLMMASFHGHVEVLRLLIDHEDAIINLNAQDNEGETALYHSCTNGHRAIVKLLPVHGADPAIADREGRTPLIKVTMRSDLEVVHLLFKHGGAVSINNINAQGPEGATALYNSCECDHPAITKFLLEKGASPAIACNNGVTPLISAARRGHGEVVPNLCSHKEIDVDFRALTGNTPLHISCLKGVLK